MPAGVVLGQHVFFGIIIRQKRRDEPRGEAQIDGAVDPAELRIDLDEDAREVVSLAVDVAAQDHGRQGRVLDRQLHEQRFRLH